MANRLWKVGTRRGIAYVEGRDVAERVLTAAGLATPPATAPDPPAPRRKAADAGPLEAAMAVYSDRRGRPFAWQIPFDVGRWDAVAAEVQGAE